jgi:hypothetical protein
MSRGSKVKTMRIYPILETAVNLCIAQRNAYSRRPPWDFTGFIHAAIWEKLAKMERSRKPRRRKKAAASGEKNPALSVSPLPNESAKS